MFNIFLVIISFTEILKFEKIKILMTLLNYYLSLNYESLAEKRKKYLRMLKLLFKKKKCKLKFNIRAFVRFRVIWR